MTKQNRFEGSVCINLGYKFIIDAPGQLDADAVDIIMRAFVDYSDEMSQEMFNQMLNEDSDYCELEQLTDEQLELAKQIEIYFEIVSSDNYLNDNSVII